MDERFNEFKLPYIMRILSASVYAGYTASLGGSESRNRWFNFYKSVQSGSLVMETSTIHNRALDWCRFGRLVSNDFEPMFTNDEWEELKEDYDNQRPTERKWRIKLLTNDQDYCWTNADFICVPEKTIFSSIFEIKKPSKLESGIKSDSPPAK